MSASVEHPPHAPTPDVADFANGQVVLRSGGGGGSLLEAIIVFSRTQPATTTISILMLLLLIYYALLGGSGKPGSNLPVINPQPLRKRYQAQNRMRLAVETKENLIAGRKKFGPDQVFVVNGLAGSLVALPPRFINEIRNDKDFDVQDTDSTVVGSTIFYGIPAS